MSKRKKKPTKNFNPKYLKSDILKLFKRSAKKRYHGRQIIKKLKLQGVSLSTVDAHLESLEKEGHILLLANGKYRLNKTAPAVAGDFAVGRVDMTQRGTAFIIVEGLDSDIHVGARHLNYALHGDTVKVRYTQARNGMRPEGKIIEVVERATDHFIGEINISASFAFVIPDSNRMPVDIFVPLEHKGEAKNGDKVVVKVVSWHGAKNRSPIGQVTAVLGKPGSSDIEMKAILIGAGFELNFPEAVLEEANQLTDQLTTAEIESRRDFRDITTITIDPKTAKDFDDALSIQRLDNGNIQIGVHIADVTHYVKEGSELDKEAYKRSTSVYLVDRVLPMLPEKLSNEYCSLRPKEQSACFSAVFEFDHEFKVVDRWFGKTLIFSDHRFAYEEAQVILDAGEGLYAEELGLMNRIAHALRKDRFKHGSISFESPEVQFELDDEGNPLSVYLKSRQDAHMMIEDFMLLANREVAAFMSKRVEGKPVPFVYRVHDLPDETKVGEFAQFALEMGYKMKIDSPKQISTAFNKLTKQAEEDEELKMLLPMAIRTMAKAEYTTENIGHYGLGFEDYTHFTSPIRRYSDVLVHRLLQKNLEKVYRVKEDELELKCKHISAQERKAMEAERESVKYKQVEFMEKRIGEAFDGIVSGIIERGVFVELTENYCEGFVPFDSFPEPMYAENKFRFSGNRSGKVYKIGDPIKVRIVNVDFARRRIEMSYLQAGEEEE